MATASNFGLSVRQAVTDDIGTRTGVSGTTARDDNSNEKPKELAGITINEAGQPGSPDDEGIPTISDAQRGVRQVEAVTLTWSKRSLISIFILCGQLADPH